MEARNIKSKSSITALSVASAFQRALDKKYHYLFSSNESKLLDHICQQAIKSFPTMSMNGFLANSIFISPHAIQTLFFNNVVGQYYEEFILLRKLLIKEKINNAIENGAKQIVFLGGGYDIRAFIGAQEHPDVNFYELDRGITRENKLNAMATIPDELGYNNFKIETISSTATIINNNLFYLECDFSTDDLSETLNIYGFDKTQPTIIIGEGLTMYLDEQENEHTLRLANNLLNHPDSGLLIGYATKPIVESSLSDLAKQDSNENYKFYLPPQNVIPFSQKSGMCVAETKLPVNLLSHIGEMDGKIYFQSTKDANTFEQYYFIKNGIFMDNNITEIHDIPAIDILIPTPPESTPSTCFQM